jgi:hypothetical protein
MNLNLLVYVNVIYLFENEAGFGGRMEAIGVEKRGMGEEGEYMFTFIV